MPGTGTHVDCIGNMRSPSGRLIECSIDCDTVVASTWNSIRFTCVSFMNEVISYVLRSFNSALDADARLTRCNHEILDTRPTEVRATCHLSTQDLVPRSPQ